MDNFALEKLDAKKLGLPLDIPTVIEIAYRSMKGEIVTLDDIASVYCGGDLVKATKLITNQVFNQMVHHLARANAQLAFDATAFKSLLDISRFSLDEKNRISAIKALGDIIGRNESKQGKQSNTNININLDAIVRNTEASPFKGF